MTDIIICVFIFIGILFCGIIENIMWEHDREKAFGYELEQKKENRNER